jgi:hypothetical protein
MQELRCEYKLHGILMSDGFVEFKCSSALCGKEPGVVVIHRFSIETGELVSTRRFKDTPKVNKRNRRVA